MGHYSDCYERDEEQYRKERAKQVERLTKEYQSEINRYGIAGFLARKKVYG